MQGTRHFETTAKKEGVLPKKTSKKSSHYRSNQLWETDIKYGYIKGEDRFFFILSYIDVYDRSIIDYHIGLSCSGENAKQTLQRALLKRQQFDQEKKPIIRSDNGPQFISHAFEQGCESFQVEHERIPPKTPNMNARIKSFHRILEEDCLSRFQFQTYGEAYQEVSEFMRFYNDRRMHSSILDLAPTEFYEMSKVQSLKIKEIRV